MKYEIDWSFLKVSVAISLIVGIVNAMIGAGVAIFLWLPCRVDQAILAAIAGGLIGFGIGVFASWIIQDYCLMVLGKSQDFSASTPGESVGCEQSELRNVTPHA